MSSPASVSILIGRLREGDVVAVGSLWDKYARRITALANRKLRGPRCMADEEDVALSAFQSLTDGLLHGRFTRMANRNDLWNLMLVITRRKARRLTQHEFREKRGDGRVKYETEAFRAGHDTATLAGMDQLAGPTPTPHLTVLLAEEFNHRMAQLPDDNFRRLAELKFQGYNHEEIAKRLACSLRSVERRLHMIRAIWRERAVP